MAAPCLVKMPNGSYVTAADIGFLRQVLGDDGARRVLTMDGVQLRRTYKPSIGPRRYSKKYFAKIESDAQWAGLGPEGERLRAAGYGIYQAKAALGRGMAPGASARIAKRARAEGLIPARAPAQRQSQAIARTAQRPRASWGARAARVNELAAIDVDPTKQKPWYADLASQALTVWQAEQFRKENARRIREGLPLLTQAQARALAPTANVNVALPVEVKLGALFLGAAVLVAVLRRRR